MKIKFVETNVDGCGSDAVVFVNIEADTNEKTANDYEEQLIKSINEMRTAWDPDEWDTDSVVREAIKTVFGEHAKYEFLLPDAVVEF